MANDTANPAGTPASQPLRFVLDRNCPECDWPELDAVRTTPGVGYDECGRCGFQTASIDACRYARVSDDHQCVTNQGQPIRPGQTCHYEAAAQLRDFRNACMECGAVPHPDTGVETHAENCSVPVPLVVPDHAESGDEPAGAWLVTVVAEDGRRRYWLPGRGEAVARELAEQEGGTVRFIRGRELDDMEAMREACYEAEYEARMEALSDV